jgi:FixJ family two-component response regulator
MPGMNGRALAERLLPKQLGMRVLYISGYTDSFVARHGVLEEGMVLLHKPFTEEVLIRKVREVLDIKTAGAPKLETGQYIGQGHENPGQGREKK